MSDTDWIKPGGEVVFWNDSSTHVGEVTTVGTAGFDVSGTGERFLRSSLRSAGWRAYHVAPMDSDEGRAALARHDVVVRALRAVDEWQRDRTREARLAAIEALQAVED